VHFFLCIKVGLYHRAHHRRCLKRRENSKSSVPRGAHIFYNGGSGQSFYLCSKIKNEFFKNHIILKDNPKSFKHVHLPDLRPKASITEPHHFYATPARSKNFDAAPAAPAPTLVYSKAKFLK
jgi:hypothetical protein